MQNWDQNARTQKNALGSCMRPALFVQRGGFYCSAAEQASYTSRTHATNEPSREGQGITRGLPPVCILLVLLTYAASSVSPGFFVM